MSRGLCGGAVVAMVQPVDLGTATMRPAAGGMTGRGVGESLSRLIRDVILHEAAAVRSAHDDHEIEAFATNGSDEAFDVGVGMSRQLHRRRAVRCKPFE